MCNYFTWSEGFGDKSWLETTPQKLAISESNIDWPNSCWAALVKARQSKMRTASVDSELVSKLSNWPIVWRPFGGLPRTG